MLVHLRTWGLVLSLGLGVVACSGSEAPADDGGGGEGGLDTDAGTGGGSGGTVVGNTGGSESGTGGSTPVAEECGPAASTNEQGVLSAFPHIATTIAEGYELISFNFVVIEDGDERGPLLEFYAEIRNTSLERVCGFLPEVYLDGQEVVTQGFGQPFHLSIGSTLFSTVEDCLSPGATGVLAGVQRGISEADLADSTTLSVDPKHFSLPSDEYSLGNSPTLDAEVAEADGEYLLEGTVTFLEDSYNHGIRVFPRDARGLVVGELLAFPGNLGDHSAGDSVEFATGTVDCRFTDYAVFQSWIRRD